ncbi:MAG: CHC2 zinc finger domain-containing protein, partial [Candidatus Omnitrophica bacterium]|nr:CHC2 zinc finger domain-containing protein [Candidatus Omnitrophota bacterium]
MIPQSFIDDIQTRTDIVEVISGYIPLKRAGRNFKANCPFHGEKTASFMISPQKQIFHCFGCGEGGGVIQFLMMHEKMTFVEAVETLAKRR